ncbi:serine/threonine-protein kinase [Pontibacterium granulatum]|uniref:serine/threonine-protein kinase n=1 Tax=Pontibacterium granulatum TaxID=2036029 RepID=UPI00249A2D43|nr:serine/threonine-protein kinase [Pontibacterium granulatum]MDI3325352.1 serine/threonine-protein kinase [Pontibacterium granulatum]
MAFLCGYEIIEEVATGGFSTVYRVQEAEPPYREFAAKKFNDVSDHAVFEQEVLSLDTVSGTPGTQQLFRAIRHKDNLIILTHYVEGEPLKSRIDRDGPLDEREAVRIISFIADTLHLLHQKKIHHLDVKPSNVLIDQNGTLTLTDFGIAEPSYRQRSEVAKTDFSYTAPEKYHGHQTATSDIYSLGVSLHYLVTGTLPFHIHATSDANKMLNHCTQPVKLPAKLSDSMRLLIKSMMEKPSDKRITLKQLREQLQTLSIIRLNNQPLPKPSKTKTNTPTEKECFAEAARRNIPFGQYRYALLCEDENKEEALYWYEQAANAGFARAQNNLALLYMNLGNTQQAVKWYTEGAKAGNAFSQYNLARLYDQQDDTEKANHWYERAANSGHDRAQNTVAIHLENKQQFKRAFSLYQRAAYSGFRAAQFNLGLMYENERAPTNGTSSREMAKFWYEKAAAQNHSKAKKRLSILNNQGKER